MSEQANHRVALGTMLEVSMAAELYGRLAEALAEGVKAIELDGSELERVDGAGLQLLLAFMQEAERQQVDCSWAESPAMLVDAARLLGMDSALKLQAGPA